MNNSVADHDTGISLVEQVYRKIKASILSSEYCPGYQALEPEIAKILGVSRTPVREALIRLEAEKLIELIPRRGMRVLPLLPDDILELNEIITGLEHAAVEALAKRKPSKDVLAPMLSALDEMDAAISSGDLVVWVEADDTFHRLLVGFSENRRLATMIDNVRAQISRARKITLKLRNNLRNSNVAHRALYECLLAGDVVKAKEVHYEHRLNVESEVRQILETYQFPHL